MPYSSKLLRRVVIFCTLHWSPESEHGVEEASEPLGYISGGDVQVERWSAGERIFHITDPLETWTREHAK